VNFNKLAAIDFEYYDTAEEKLKLVCASVVIRPETAVPLSYNFWLHDDSDTYRLKTLLYKLRESDYTLLAYNVTAEASSVLSLGCNPLHNNWVDLYLEYRQLSNHNDNYAYGKQLIKGKVKTTKRPLPKWQRNTEEDEKKAEAQKQEYGLGAAVFKTTGIVIDNEFKKEIRDLIIACNKGNEETIEAMIARKQDIMDYCASDTKYLFNIFEAFIKEYQRLLKSDFDMDKLKTYMKNRSEYAIRTAIMERKGYPIAVSRTSNFSSQVGNIVWKCQQDINSQFDFKLFRAKSKKKPFDLSWDQKKTREELKKWLKANGYKGWTLTDGGKKGIKDLSLSLKAFQKPIKYNHTYPEGNLIAQMQRYLKLKQGLNGFTAGGKSKKNFWDHVGADGRVRPYFGIYGAQSSRSQPSATSFIPLKSAWMRNLIEAPKGRAICGIDFASQEFLLGALMSGDQAMIRAYESGDVYLAFGKDINYIPKDATKSSHKELRDQCKAVVLSLSYDMSEYGLAIDLSEKFKRPVTTDEALKWINKHKMAYTTFHKFKEKIQREYKFKKRITLPDGWMMFGDNDNFRSVGNMPIQGFGASIMRKAVQLAQDAGLDVIYTLHDAIYIEFDSDDLSAVVKLAECMDTAFRFYFSDETKPKATVRLDADIWSLDYTEGKMDLGYSGADGKLYTLPVKSQQTYVDERGADDFEKFKVYFDDINFDNLEF